MKNWRNYLIAALVGALIVVAADPRPEASFGLAFKQIQCGDITIANGTSSNTATITAVVTAKTVVLHNGSRGTNAVPNTLELTNTTTLTATRTGTTNDLIVRYCTLEFY